MADITTAAQSNLETYLTDHDGGSASGRALARRLLQANEGTPYAADYRQLADDIDSDSASLRRIMGSFGIRPRALRQLAGPLTAVATRLHGVIGGYTALHRLREVEALAAGVATKRSLWEALRTIDHPALDRGELDRLIERAVAQYDTLMDHRDRSAADAFAGL